MGDWIKVTGAKYKDEWIIDKRNIKEVESFDEHRTIRFYDGREFNVLESINLLLKRINGKRWAE